VINSDTQEIRYTPEQLSQILNKLMTLYEIDGVRLSQKTGIPTTTINRLRKSDPNNNPTLLTLIPLAKFFSITVSQLIGETNLPDNSLPLPKFSQLPILSWEESVNWSNLNDKSRLSITTENEYSDKAFALIIEDDDFEKLSKGTILLIDPSLEPKHHDYAIVHRKEQKKATLKQIVIEDSKYFLKSVITSTSIVELMPEDKILGVLVEYKKYVRK